MILLIKMHKNVGKLQAIQRPTDSYRRSEYSFDKVNRSILAKTERDFESQLLDRTGFESERAEFFSVMVQVRALRLVEFLGRYLPLFDKTQRLLDFEGLLIRLRQLLANMKLSSELYGQLAETEPNPNPPTKSIYPEDDSFESKMAKQIKSVESAWNELFKEGNLRRLSAVLELANIYTIKIDLS